MYVALALMLIGTFALVVGGIMILVVAFKKNILWGLGSMFVPFVALVFVFLYWEETKKGFLISIGGMVLSVLGLVAAPSLLGLGGTAEQSSQDSSQIQDMPAYQTPVPSAEMSPPGQPLSQVDQTPIGLPDLTLEPTPLPTQVPIRTNTSEDNENLSPASTLSRQAGHRVELFFKNGKRSHVNVVGMGMRGVKVTERVGAGEMTYEVRIDTLEGFRLIR